MGNWILRLDQRDATGLAGLRHLDLQYAAEGETWWIRGAALNAESRQIVASVPSAEWFRLLPDGQLCRAGNRVPSGWLPELKWSPLRSAFALGLPAAAFAGKVISQEPLKLTRCEEFAEPDVLLLRFEIFANWAEHAPEVRLQPLRFAVRGDGVTAIQGTPLPPLDGVRCATRMGIAIQAGFTWTPHFTGEAMTSAWGLQTDDLVIWLADQPIDCIRSVHWVQCERSAIRATLRALQTGTPS